MGSSESKTDLGNVQMVGITFLWKIENHSKISTDEWCKSPMFISSKQNYYLDLLKSKDLEIRLNVAENSTGSSNLRCKASIVDRKGHEQFLKIKEITINKENNAVTLLKVKASDLQNKFILSPKDTLNICFNANILDDDENSCTLRETLNVTIPEPLELLSSDFGRYYMNKSNTDVKLKAGDISFPVHRAILSARSTVFAAMFKNDTLEAREGKVDIRDVLPHILDELLYYIYTGKFHDLNTSVAILLYPAADKYNLQELKEECRKFIISSLSPKYIYDAAVLANTYKENSIKDAIVQLIEKEKEILNDELWKIFAKEKPYLANSILSDALCLQK